MPFTIVDQQRGFGITDYVLFSILTFGACAGGLWYSAVGSKRENIVDLKDYLLGGKAMATIPVSLSLIASYVSGVTILGTPAEIYNYGSQYWLVSSGVVLSSIIVATVYLPVFITLQLSSSYEYLEFRFNRHVRAVASILFLLDEVMFVPMVVYVPALAFNQMTGFNVYAVASAMVIITGLYTILGGLRAVVFTDSVQMAVMFGGVMIVTIAGTIAVNGISTIVEVAGDNGRLDLKNWSLSPYERQTGWGAIFGGGIYWTCYNSVNQTMVQRYISLPSKKNAYIALSIFCAGAILAISLCVWCGLEAWTAWVITGCSPAGAPIADDRLLPAFVTWVSKKKNMPGLAGVFLSGVFGAGLSSLSVVMNACALVGVEDLLRGWLRLRLEPFTEGLIARSISFSLAVLSVLMLYVVSQLGGVLGVATALSAIAASTTCGIFTLGMICWWVGPRGAITGAIAGAIVAGTVSLGSQAAAAAGLRAPPMPFNATCAANATYTKDNHTTIDPTTIFPLFRLSYHWIAPMGLFTTLTVGAIAGLLLDEHGKRKLDPELFTPVIWRLLPDNAVAEIGESRRLAARRETDRLMGISQPLIVLTPKNDNKTENKGESSKTGGGV